MQLKPKTFRYRTEDKENAKMNLPEGYHAGLVAQDLQEVFRELVKPVTITEDDKDKSKPVATRTILAANYIELIPVLVKAIQEQQAQIAELQYQVASLTGKK
jgi:hypothetical protein